MTQNKGASLSVQEYHHDRLMKYIDARQVSMDIAVHELIFLHRKGVNVAKHMSAIIGENHDQYKRLLSNLGEHHTFIR
jgi:hypothetical protein